MLAQPAIRPTRQLKGHRMVGICGALLGFLLLFMGILMLAMKEITHSKTDRAMLISGPICLTLGLIFILMGFVHQFLTHKKWKRKNKRKSTGEKSRSKAYVSVNGDIHPTVNGIVLGVNSLEPGMRVDTNGLMLQGDYDEYANYSTHMSTDIYMREEPLAGTSIEHDDPQPGTSAGIGSVLDTITGPAVYHRYYGTAEGEDDDESVSVTMDIAQSCRSPSLENYGFDYDESEEYYPYSLDESQGYGYVTEEYDGPSLEYEPPKCYTNPEIFCVSHSVMEVPSENSLKEPSSGKTPRYSRYSSKATLKQLLPSLKLPRLKSPRQSKHSSSATTHKNIGSKPEETRSLPSPEPSTNEPSPVEYTEHKSLNSKLHFKLPALLTKKSKESENKLPEAEMVVSAPTCDTPVPLVTVTSLPSLTNVCVDSRPPSADSSSSGSTSRPQSALKSAEKVVRAEVHVSFSLPDSGRASSLSSSRNSSCNDLKTSRSLSTTSITESAQNSQIADNMPDAV